MLSSGLSIPINEDTLLYGFNIIAIDFDGTLCSNAYPKIGKPNRELIKLLKYHKAYSKDKYILYTCRTGKLLDEAVEWCKNQGLYFNAVNENIPEVLDNWRNDDGTVDESRKITYTVLIDDRNLFMSSVNDNQTDYKEVNKILYELLEYHIDYFGGVNGAGEATCGWCKRKAEKHTKSCIIGRMEDVLRQRKHKLPIWNNYF